MRRAVIVQRAQTEDEFVPLEVEELRDNWVVLECEVRRGGGLAHRVSRVTSPQLLNWRYGTSKLRVKTSMPVFMLRDELREKHGRVSDLRVYRDHPSEANELRGEFKVCRRASQGSARSRRPPECASQTLAECGIRGAPEGVEPPTQRVVYDFRPLEFDDPLLL